MKMIDVSRVSDRLLAYNEDFDRDMCDAYVMDAAIQFLIDTKLNRESECFPLDPCVNSYKLHPKMRLYEVRRVQLLHRYGVVDPRHYVYHIEDDTIYFDFNEVCKCFRPNQAEVTYTTLPRRDDRQIPEYLYEERLEALVAYALYKLYSMPDADWASTRSAQVHLAAYNDYVTDARLSNISKHRAFEPKLRNVML